MEPKETKSLPGEFEYRWSPALYLVSKYWNSRAGRDFRRRKQQGSFVFLSRLPRFFLFFFVKLPEKYSL